MTPERDTLDARLRETIASWAGAPSPPPDPIEVEQAVLRAVAYADVFDYPLRVAEVHRHLHGIAATAEATAAALDRCSGEAGPLSSRDGFYMLRGREGIIEQRRARTELARGLWPAAVRYGRVIGRLPFVRMVAVTGSLPWDTLRGPQPHEGDIDYFIVARPGRVWLCRVFVMVLGRMARLQRIKLCPNYFVSERALDLSDRTIYTAYELTRMVPITGLEIYWRLRELNTWAGDFLPNALHPRSLPAVERIPLQRWYEPALSWVFWLAELVLRTPLGGMLERLERLYRTNKMRRARKKTDHTFPESVIDPDRFKSHMDNQRQILIAFGERLSSLGLQTLP